MNLPNFVNFDQFNALRARMGTSRLGRFGKPSAEELAANAEAMVGDTVTPASTSDNAAPAPAKPPRKAAKRPRAKAKATAARKASATPKAKAAANKPPARAKKAAAASTGKARKARTPKAD